jgi:hypothetical protein
MIQITKGQVNTVALTLTEKSTLTNPEYLFVFQNDESRVNYIFIAQDVSVWPSRYNKFEIEETSSEDVLNGKIELVEGFYKYTIYEQASATNLDPDLATGIVEVGKVQVIGSTTVDNEYTNTNNINYVYNE